MPSLPPKSLASLLQTAVSTQSTRLGKATHAKIIKTLLHHHSPFLSNHLINTYSKLDLLNSAQLVLQLTPPIHRSVVSWTSIISGSVQSGHFASAINHFLHMRREEILPNDFTFPGVFKAAALLQWRDVGEQAHALAVKTGLIWDVFVGCSCFDMYSKLGLRDEAVKLFDEMPDRNLVTWNAYMSNAVLDGRAMKAVDAFIEFRRIGGEPDSITYCAFLNACAALSSLKLGSQLHGFVVRTGFEKNVSVSNGLIDFYGKCKDLEMAEMVFNEIGIRKNDVSWGSLVAVLVQNDEDEKCCEVFLQAREKGEEPTDFMISSVLSACAKLAGLELGKLIHGLAVKACVETNIFVGSSLVNMYGKCGAVESSEKVFYEMSDKNLVTWNAMIDAYAHQGQSDIAVRLFDEMTSGGGSVLPNYVTLVCVLSACSKAGEVNKGMEIFESMRENYGIEPREEHYACIVDLLGRAGMVDNAYEFVTKMPISPPIAVWGALLNACRMYGKPELGKIAANKLFELDPKDSGYHVLLSNSLATVGRWDESNFIRMEMNDIGIKKSVGYSWIFAKNKNHVFRAKDTSHASNTEIQAMLATLTRRMEAAGYTPDTNFALYDLEEEEKITEVGYHSEKIALAFGLIAIPRGVPIRITKNMRICGDCHNAFKLASGIFGREIVVRDNNRFHRFRDWQCSCRDHW
ncbi:hypothetical protein ACFE04_017690 [Oxalis oulophora]